MEPQANSNPFDDPESGSGLDIKRLFTEHKVLLLFCALLGCGFGYYKFTRMPAVYRSSARVLVARDKVRLPVEGMESNHNHQSSLNTHIELLRTPVILSQAVEVGALDQLPHFQGNSNIAGTIGGGLNVSLTRTSDEILDLSYECGSAETCPKVINAVIAAYMDFVSESQKKLNQKTTELITAAKEDLFKQLREKEEAYDEFRKNSSLVWHGDAAHNIHAARLARIESERTQLQTERTSMTLELESINAGLKAGKNRDAILMMALRQFPSEEELKTDEEILAAELPPRPEAPVFAEVPEELSQGILPLKLREQELTRKLGASHPNVLAVREEIATTLKFIQEQNQLKKKLAQDEYERKLKFHEKLVERMKADHEEKVKKALDFAESGEQPAETDLLVTYIQSVEQKIDVVDRKLNELNAQYKLEAEAAKVVAVEENRDRALKEDIQRTKDLYDLLLEELQEVNLVKGGNFLAVETISEPGMGYQVAPKLTDNLMFGGFLGAAAGLALAFLMEMSDRSFHGPEQIMKELKLPVLGHVPVIDKKQKKQGSLLDATLVAHHRPSSRLAEAYRAIRAPIVFGVAKDGLKVLQVTSPDPGDGKSTLAANFAITMANSGKKCLLVDCDFRRPRVHKLFGVDNNSGIGNVIKGQVELPDAILETEVENLDIMTTGAKMSQSTEQILSARFDEVMNMLREKYDFIVVDTPPVLAVTDPCAVAAKVDGVLLAMRITKRVKLHAGRAKEALEMVGAKILGVAVNGLGDASRYGANSVYSAKASEYQYSKSPYYGSKYYGYKQYGYGYSEYYAEKDNEANLENAEQAESVDT